MNQDSLYATKHIACLLLGSILGLAVIAVLAVAFATVIS